MVNRKSPDLDSRLMQTHVLGLDTGLVRIRKDLTIETGFMSQDMVVCLV